MNLINVRSKKPPKDAPKPKRSFGNKKKPFDGVK